VAIDQGARTICVAEATLLDVGASAKALAADRIATLIASALNTSVLVDLGGDIAVGGPALGEGWAVGVGPVSGGHAEQVVALRSGGLATSCPDVRTWRVGAQLVSHIVDPRTGRPARSVWRSASVFAPTCVEANALSTAAIVWGQSAPAEIAVRGGHARLVDYEGRVHHIGAWPQAAPHAA
jgi:thiamine biosynthesis lipoprotein